MVTTATEDRYGVRSRARRKGPGQWRQAGNLPVALRTLNGVDLTDRVAESVAEAGDPGYSLIHPGHGIVEVGLSAGKDTGLSPSTLPHP